MALLLVAAFMATIIWGLKSKKEVKRLKEIVRPIADIDAYVRASRKSADTSLANAQNRLDIARIESLQIIEAAKKQAQNEVDQVKSRIAQILAAAQEEEKQIRCRIAEVNLQINESNRELQIIREALRLQADDAHLLEIGYYEPTYAFANDIEYEEEITRIKKKQKEMLRVGGEKGDRMAAAFVSKKKIYNGLENEGHRLIKIILRLMLRAFNGECDSFIARVNFRNITTMEKRILSSFDQINKLAANWKCEINKLYLNNRIAELRLVYEFSELEQKIKEEQAAIREQEREDEKARREAERRERDAARREAEAQKAIEEARAALDHASSNEAEAYRKRIAELERQLSEVQEERRRAKSLAEQTRAGYVYIFSNVGSFGEHVYKIGMTRREVPDERRLELSGASVPFPFDCHSYIWSEDAPALERALHIHFEARRVNFDNLRKEFFRITIEEIKSEVEKLKQELGITAEIRWTLMAEAKSYHLSEAKRKHLENSLRVAGSTSHNLLNRD